MAAMPPGAPTSAELSARMESLAADSTAPVRRQHVVSRVVLKRFAKPNSDGAVQLFAYNLEYGRGRCRGVRECGKIPDLIQVASGSAEQMWNKVENRLGPVLDEIETGQLGSAASIQIAKSAVVLHFLRSVYLHTVMRVVTQQAKAWICETLYLDLRDLLKREFLRRRGLHVNNDEVLKDLFRQLIDEHNLVSTALVTRANLEWLFPRMMRHAEGMSLDLVRAEAGGEYVIGDAPAVSFQQGNPHIGYQNGVGLLRADLLMLPVSPRFTIVLSSQGATKIVQGANYSTEFLNTLQIRHAYRHVYMSPGSTMLTFVEANASLWRMPAAVDATAFV